MKILGLCLAMMALTACDTVGSRCAEYCGDRLGCAQGLLDVDACQAGCEEQGDDDAFMDRVDCFNEAEDACTAYEECNPDAS